MLDMENMECQYEENKEFYDPGPFTLETAFASTSDLLKSFFIDSDITEI